MTATEVLAVVAVATGGLAAGCTLDRSVVALPAWNRVGVEGWAAFSRRADLGRSLIFYPTVGVTTWLASMATAAAFAIQGGPAAAGAAVYAAAALSLIPAFATSRAAPNMLRIRQTRDVVDLTMSLTGFTRWNHVRAISQTVAFAASLWALVSLLTHGS